MHGVGSSRCGGGGQRRQQQQQQQQQQQYKLIIYLDTGAESKKGSRAAELRLLATVAVMTCHVVRCLCDVVVVVWWRWTATVAAAAAAAAPAV